MEPLQFAERYFQQFKQHGSEIIPTYCPYCSGGSNRDKNTFALNIDNLTFNCKRGTCGKQGTFTQLCRDFGEQTDKHITYERKPILRTYKEPTEPLQPATQNIEKYLQKRGFSNATWEQRQVSESQGNITFPYYEGGKLVLLKFRKPEKYTGKGQKAWRSKDCKPVFWGMDDCRQDKPLVIVEGEYDALALDEAGIPNVVSVPSGAEDLTCVDLCWDWLQQFKKIIIWPDNDEPGQDMCRKLITRLGAWRCYVVHSERKDANEVLVYDGKDAVKDAITGAAEVPINGLIRLADVKAFDYENVLRVKSGITAIDKVVGGFMMGQVSVWTGANSSGKSTILGQILLDTIDQGFGLCAYSGELPAPVYRYWIDLQAAGIAFISEKYDHIRGENVCFVETKIANIIREWYRESFFLYDSFGTTTDDGLLKIFEYAAMRHDCKVFLIDNLMTTAFSGAASDFYRKQSEFVGKVIDFAHRHEVHVHLVAHPRKTDGTITKIDVAGSGDITNRADNVFAIQRCTQEQKLEKGCDTLLHILKNRFSGRQDVVVEMMFNNDCKRFYMKNEPNSLYKSYKWVK